MSSFGDLVKVSAKCSMDPESLVMSWLLLPSRYFTILGRSFAPLVELTTLDMLILPLYGIPGGDRLDLLSHSSRFDGTRIMCSLVREVSYAQHCTHQHYFVYTW